MKTYTCTDAAAAGDRSAEKTIVANSADEAAQEYVDGGVWEDDSPVNVIVRIDGQDDETIPLRP